MLAVGTCLSLVAWLSEAPELMGNGHLLLWPRYNWLWWLHVAKEQEVLSWEGGNILMSCLLHIQVNKLCKKQ